MQSIRLNVDVLDVGVAITDERLEAIDLRAEQHAVELVDREEELLRLNLRRRRDARPVAIRAAPELGRLLGPGGRPGPKARWGGGRRPAS